MSGAKIKIINEDVDNINNVSALNNSQFNLDKMHRSNQFLDPKSCANSSEFLSRSKAPSLSNIAGK